MELHPETLRARVSVRDGHVEGVSGVLSVQSVVLHPETLRMRVRVREGHVVDVFGVLSVIWTRCVSLTCSSASAVDTLWTSAVFLASSLWCCTQKRYVRV